MVSLLQFYDPQLWCFTLQDYQLAPTLEEYAYILDIEITSCIPFSRVPEVPDHAAIARALYLGLSEVRNNWTNKSNMPGVHMLFLISKAK